MVGEDFVTGMRELVAALGGAPADTPEARLRETLTAALDEYDRSESTEAMRARLEDAERWPAHVVVHWPTGPHPACLEHARQLMGLAAFLGNHVATAPLTRAEACVNCKTEAEEKRT